MSKGVVASLELVAAAVAAYYGDWSDAAALANAAYNTERAARAEITARNAYNRSLHDRYVQIRSTQAPRQLVFGRCRVSGPTFFVSSWGSDKQQLTYLVALAGHELDAIETIFFDDKPVSLDGSGNVIGIVDTDSFSIAAATATVAIQYPPVAGTVTAVARYGEDVVALGVSVSGQNVTVSGARPTQTGQLDVSYQPNPDPYGPISRTQRSQAFTIVTGHDSFTLSTAPDATGIHVVYRATSGTADDSSPISATLSALTVTISGGTVGRTAVVYYQTSSGLTKARVRKYLGTGTQAADATMQMEFPGVWTASHRALGVAYLVVELTYDQDAFIGGAPNVSAVVRGMKCFDPRNGTTAWTENPALHARALATHSLAGNLASTSIDDAAVIAAANVCDVSTTYTVGSVAHVRPLYTSAYTYNADQKPKDGLTDLCQAMGGIWVWSDGRLRLLAGTYRVPNPGVLDETWLVDDGPVTVQVGSARTELLNTITSTIADQYQEYRVVPLPRLAPPAYVAADDATLPQSIQYSAIAFSGQAQYVSSCLLRRQRQGVTLNLHCNYRAWTAEVGDNLLVSLSRFGWSAKPFEVIEDTWSTDGSFELTLQETDASIWNMDAGFPATDPAPNTSFPSPWGLLPPANLTLTSNDSTLLRQADGTVVPRISVSWDAITDSRILQGGYVEVRYWRLGDPTDSYLSIRTAGTNSQVYLPDTRVGSQYLVAARAGSVVTQSPWTDQTGTAVFGKTTAPGNVTGAAYLVDNGRAHLTWDAATDVDYKLTEVRYGASWAAGTLLGRSLSTNLDWVGPTVGTATLWFAHQNWSGIYSTTPSAITIVTANPNLGDLENENDGPRPVSSSVAFINDGTTDAGGRWFLGTLVGTYYIRFDQVSGTAVTSSGTLGTQLSLASNQYVQITKSTVGRATAVVSYRIYDSTGNAVSTGNIYLTAVAS